jgi:formate-dependent nitrite reductase cytochrome c552 subunit
MGVDPAKLTRQEMRSAVCAQCHVTYNIPKDQEGKSVGLYFPWQNIQVRRHQHREHHPSRSAATRA